MGWTPDWWDRWSCGNVVCMSGERRRYTRELPLTVLQILAIDLSTETLSRSRWAANAPSPKSWTDRRALDRKRRGRPHARPRLRPARRGLAGFFFTLVSGGWHPGAD